MSLSSSLPRIGISVGTLCIAATLWGVGTTAMAEDDGGPTTPPPTTTTTPATTDGHPWHN